MSPPDLFQIRSGALMGYLALAEECHLNLDELLAAAGLSREQLEQPEQMLPYPNFEGLLERSALHSGRSDFGLLLSKKQDLSMLGALGSVLSQCSTVLEAARLARHYLSYHVPAEFWVLDVGEKFTSISRFQHRHVANVRGQGRELSLGVCFGLLKHLAGHDFRCELVTFSHHPLSPTSLYQSYFQAPVLFNQETDQIRFASHYLERPIQVSEGQLEMAASRHLDKQLAFYGNNLERKVRCVLLHGLAQNMHRLHDIAGILNLHPRTLQRRLESSGLNYQAILLDVRMDTARALLSSSDIDLTALAQMLAYADLSTFSKAFKQVHHCSPRVWRQLLRQS